MDVPFFIFIFMPKIYNCKKFNSTEKDSPVKMLMLLIIMISPIISYTNECPQIIREHQLRLMPFEDLKLNLIQQQIKKLIDKYDEGKLTPQMKNYFSINPQQALDFRYSAAMAEKLSRMICLVEKDIRHFDDEVDGIRHVLFAGFLTERLGVTNALNILSLQENRSSADPHSVLMDLENNQLGIEFAEEAHEKDSDVFLQELILFAKKTFLSGDLTVLKSKKSDCQRKEFYPNL